MENDNSNANLRAVCPNCRASCKLDEEFGDSLGMLLDDDGTIPFTDCISHLMMVVDLHCQRNDELNQKYDELWNVYDEQKNNIRTILECYKGLSELQGNAKDIEKQKYDELKDKNRKLFESSKNALERAKNVLDIVEQAMAKASKSDPREVRVASLSRPKFHTLKCEYTKYFIVNDYRRDPSREEAIADGKKPCNTCCS